MNFVLIKINGDGGCFGVIFTFLLLLLHSFGIFPAFYFPRRSSLLGKHLSGTHLIRPKRIFAVSAGVLVHDLLKAYLRLYEGADLLVCLSVKHKIKLHHFKRTQL